MCRYCVTENPENREDGSYGIACGAVSVSGVTRDRALAEKLAALFNEEGLAPEQLEEAARDFRRDPQFFLKCIQEK